MFWDWVKNENGRGDSSFRYGLFTIFAFFIPVIIYELIAWDPIIGTAEEGEPYRLGLFIVMGLSWFAIYIHSVKHKESKRLNILIDKLLDDDQRAGLLTSARKISRKLKENKNTFRGDTDRVRWFDIE